MKKILQKEAPGLREIAESVSVSQIASPKIQKIITEMKLALDSQDDGVAIAAPQIGYSLRIFVVSGKIANIISKEKNPVTDIKTEKTEEEKPIVHSVFINPIIIKLSREKRVVEEGCLSVRYLYGKVTRASKCSAEAYDEYGKKFKRGASGLVAQIFQHETDHLNGILFIDKAK